MPIQMVKRIYDDSVDGVTRTDVKLSEYVKSDNLAEKKGAQVVHE